MESPHQLFYFDWRFREERVHRGWVRDYILEMTVHDSPPIATTVHGPEFSHMALPSYKKVRKCNLAKC